MDVERAARVARARRGLDIIGAIAAAVGIAGFVFGPSLAVLRAFLILFGLTTVPERAIRALRQRRRRSRGPAERS
jgi:hypothetical protein